MTEAPAATRNTVRVHSCGEVQPRILKFFLSNPLCKHTVRQHNWPPHSLVVQYAAVAHAVLVKAVPQVQVLAVDLSVQPPLQLGLLLDARRRSRCRAAAEQSGAGQ